MCSPPPESIDEDLLRLKRKTTWLERNAPTDDIPIALFGTGTFCGGVTSDFRMRFPFLLSDYTDGFTFKTISAALFMLCATATSTIALGDVAERETGGMVGITEYLMLQSIAGLVHAVFSACPLPILRPTGPITGELSIEESISHKRVDRRSHMIFR